jgi:hypothetical protein
LNNNSDDEDDDDYLPPYHAYTYNEDSTNSSRSAGDGDSSSLSSSSPSDTCYSFVRRALQVNVLHLFTFLRFGNFFCSHFRNLLVVKEALGSWIHGIPKIQKMTVV